MSIFYSHLAIAKTKGWHCRLFLQVSVKDRIIVASWENEMEVGVGQTDLSQQIQERLTVASIIAPPPG